MQKYLFYGAGRYAHRNIKKWVEKGIVPACFIDADPQKHYTLFRDEYEILPLMEALKKYPRHPIFLSLDPDEVYEAQARKYLSNIGFHEQMVIFENEVVAPTYSSPAELHEAVKTMDVVKLHLGCGSKYKEGWINIDKDINRGKLDLLWDLAKGIPLESDTVDYIYHEHFFEHLTRREGKWFLSECLRVLRTNVRKTGGTMRFSMPDLKEAVKEYIDESARLANKPAREGL